MNHFSQAISSNSHQREPWDPDILDRPKGGPGFYKQRLIACKLERTRLRCIALLSYHPKQALIRKLLARV
jgi:hypothetical protein